MLNWADYTIIGVIALSVLVSLIRGFVREVLSLVTWIVAVWVAFTFYNVLSNLLSNDIHNSTIRLAVSFGGLFLITLILGALINYLVGQLVDKTGLTGTDRVLGIAFGFARGTLLITVLLMMASLTPMPQNNWWKASVLIPQFKPLEVWLEGYLPKSMAQHVNLTY